MKLPPWPVNMPIPASCRLTEVLRILNISRKTFNRHEADFLLVEQPRVGRLRRFEGKSVERALRGRWADRRLAS